MPSVTSPPIDADALIAQAEAAFQAGDFQAAEAVLREAVESRPDSYRAKWKLSALLNARPGGVESIRESLRLAEELVERFPDERDAHLAALSPAFRLGLIERYHGHLAAVMDGLEESYRFFDKVQLSIATRMLEAGDLANGLPAFDRWMNEQPRVRDLNIFRSIPKWDGSALEGRAILLHTTTAGLGDAIQFIRYAPLVKARGGTVVLACPGTLAHLLAECDGLDEVIALPKEWAVKLDALDGFVQAPLFSLPAIMGTTLETVPNKVPYLSASAESVERWRPVVEAIPGLRVGITWQGDPNLDRDRLRSVPLKEFAPLAAIEGLSLVPLQKGPAVSQIESCGFPLADLGDEYRASMSWMDTAAVVSQLDLVVSPDTSVAHLSGALAKPTWIALTRPAEWRWMRDRDDSPWYPTARLFRQDRLGEWGPVFERMAAELVSRGTSGK